MKQPILTLLAFALFSHTLFAQWTQTAGPEGGKVYSVEQVGNEIWAGTQGGLYTSADNGATWQLSPIVPVEDFVSRILTHGDTVLLLASQYDLDNTDYSINVFVRTSPGGSWATYTTPVFDWDGQATAFFLNAFGLFIAGSGECYRSTDLGVSWTTLSYPNGITYPQRVQNDGNRIILDGYIYDTTYVDYNTYSDDGGNTWLPMPAFPPDFNYNQIFVENDLIILTDYDTVLARSEDFGATWQTVTVPGPQYTSLSNIRRESDGMLYALDYRLWRSADNGLTWTYGPADDADIVGAAGDFVHLSDGSFVLASVKGMYTAAADLSEWQPSNTGLRAVLVYYQFVSPEGYVYATTDQGFYVSKNAGATWEIALPDTLVDAYTFVYEMLFLGDTLVGANENGVLFSFDNGQTWSKVTPSSAAGYVYDLKGLEYFENNLYVGANGLFKTSDWGVTWTELPLPTQSGRCNDLKAVNGQLYAAFSSGDIMRTPDGGQTWTLLTELWTPGAGRNNRLEYMNGALFALGDGEPQYSTDNGSTWQELGKQGLPVSGVWGDLPELSHLANLGNLIFASVPWNGVWLTSDFGASWTPYNEGLGNLRARDLEFADSILYLGTSTGGIWRRGGAFKSVTGTVYYDDNNNGQRDPGELPYEGAIVSAQPLSTYAITPAAGTFSVFAEVFNDTLRAKAYTPYTIVSPPFYVVNDASDSLDFGIYTIPDIVDLCITITHMEPIRPGFDNSFVITVKNVGTTMASGTVRMGMPSGITYDGANPLPDQIVNDTLQWDVVNLEPGAFTNYTVLVTASTNLLLGEVVSYAAAVLPFDDENPNNNNNTERTEVVGSYDPNDKAVSPGPWLTPEELASGEPLTYTIRFENTGTYYAEFIRITDTLSPLLDAASLQILSSSHPCTWTLKGPGIVEFFFPDIWLPWFEPDKHGFVKFSVQPKRTLELGDVVENTAFIYFDFNPAIVTNTVGTTVGYPTATRNPEKLEVLRFQPNPAADYVRVYWANAPVGINRVRLYDLEGRTLMDEKFQQTGDWITVPLPRLPNGNYTLYVEKEGRTAGGTVIVTQMR